jgi:muramidase (phage lysozyme)
MAWEDVTGANPNVTRFLDFLAKAEGADWNTIVGGGKFSDFSQHPNVVGLRTAEGPSTAAGRYQITGTTYRDVAPKLGITDFSQESQNQIAIELMRRNGALDDVMAGRFEPAIQKLGKVWASLPSSPYSQPKRDWNFVKANLAASTGDDGWETITPAAKADDGWETITPAAAPTPTPAAPKQTAQAAPAPAPQRTTEESVRRGLSLGTRDVLEGAEKAFTYPVRAASDFAAGLVGLAGGGDSRAYKVLTEMGLRGRGAGALAADAAGLAKPETKTEKTVSAGIQAAAGLTPGTVLSRLTEKAPQAVQGAMSVLMPSTAGSAGQVAKDAAVFGGLGAGFEAAPAETAAVLALATAGKAGVDKALTNRAVNKMVEKAGGADAAKLDAEIIKDLKKLSESSTKRGNPMTTIDANAIETRYINDVNAALSKLGKTQDVSSVREAIMNRRALTPEDLTAIRGSAAGNAAADAIEKAQRLRSMTQAMQSSGGLLPLMREGVDLLPIPAAINRGLKAALGGRQTREVSIQKALKQADTADAVLQRLGPSSATQSMNALDTAIKQSQKSVAAKKAAEEAARLARMEKEAATKIQVLQDTRMPQTGAFANLLPGGKSNLNLSSDDAIDGLRLVSRQFKDRPVGEAAKTILRSNNVDDSTSAFYGVQNQLRKLQEQGILGTRQGGALSEATSSGVRNPISYAEAVRTAGAAADLARANAPSKELAQFATRVAGIKSPEAKAKAVADRLAKTSDPAEQAFLTQFVEPLAQFGKKSGNGDGVLGQATKAASKAPEIKTLSKEELNTDWLHGTTPENLKSILSSGKFDTSLGKKNYSYSELGHDTLYLAPKDSWWMNSADTGRAISYPSSVKAEFSKDAKIAKVDTMDDLKRISDKLGIKDPEEFLNRLMTEDYGSATHAQYRETLKKLADAKIDGIYFGKSFEAVAPDQLAIFNKNIVKPAKK